MACPDNNECPCMKRTRSRTPPASPRTSEPLVQRLLPVDLWNSLMQANNLFAINELLIECVQHTDDLIDDLSKPYEPDPDDF